MLDAGSVGSSELSILRPPSRHPHMDELSPPSSPSSSPPATPPAHLPLAGTSYTNELHQSHREAKVPHIHDPHYLLRTPSPGVYSTHTHHETASKAPSRHTHTTHRSKSSKSKSRSGDDSSLSVLMRLMHTSTISESAETIQNLMESLRATVLDRNNARAEVLSLQAQLAMYKWQMEQAQEEILRAQNIVNTLVEEKRAGEEREAKLRARVREAEALLRIRDAHQEGFQRGLHDAQRLAKHNLYPAHGLPDEVETSKSNSADGSKSSSSSRSSHNRRRSEPAVTTRKVLQQDNTVSGSRVDSKPTSGQRAASPVPRTRPRTSSLATHITPFPLNANTVPPVPPLPQVHVPAVPPARPPTRPESRAHSTSADRTTSPPPAVQSYQHDTFIPSMDTNGRFTLPPPHSLQRPVSSYTTSTMRGSAVQEQKHQEVASDPTSSSSSSSSTSHESRETEEEEYSPSFPFPRQPMVGIPPPRTRTQSLKSRASTRMSEYDLLAPSGRVPSQDGQSQRKVEEWRDALGFVPYTGPDNVAPSGIPPPPIIASQTQSSRPPLPHTSKGESESMPLPIPPPRRKMFGGGKESSTSSSGLAPGLNWLRNRFQTSRQESSATTVPQIDIESPASTPFAGQSPSSQVISQSESASGMSSGRTHVNRKLLTPEPPTYIPPQANPTPNTEETVIVSPYPNIPPPTEYREAYEVAPPPEGYTHQQPSSRTGRRRGLTVVNGGHHNKDGLQGATRRRAASVSLFNSPAP